MRRHIPLPRESQQILEGLLRLQALATNSLNVSQQPGMRSTGQVSSFACLFQCFFTTFLVRISQSQPEM